MRVAEHWKAYQLLDTSCGERLERWGTVTLIRPDPQVIWQTPKTSPLWSHADGRYQRAKTGGGAWSYAKQPPDAWPIPYQDLTFQVRPTGFKHTGLFPEQAVNWDWMRQMIAGAGRPIRVLNLFAYTGGATLACAAAGAEVCHVDAAKGMVQWARENAAMSGLQERPIRWIVDDCEKFILREARRGHRYDAIVMDPPSYGRGPGGEVWKLEDCLFGLVQACTAILSDKPLFFLLNSYTTGLSPAVMGYLLQTLMLPRFGGVVSADEIGLPVQLAHAILPCGATAIWQAGQLSSGNRECTGA